MKKLLPLLLVLLLLPACRRKASDVPRRYAYPRIEAYDTTTVQVEAGGLSFEINAGADTVVPQAGWLDVRYPRYGATLHITAQTFADFEKFVAAIDNRLERIQLNFGEIRSREEFFFNEAGFECTIVGSPSAGSAPITFFAINYDMRMLSGSAVFAGKTQPVDSIAPVYNALHDDIIKLMRSIK